MSARRCRDAAPRAGFDMLEDLGEPAIYLKPLNPCWGGAAQALRAAGIARPLCGAGAWSALELLWREAGETCSHVLPAREVETWRAGLDVAAATRVARLLAHIEGAPTGPANYAPPWPRIMGILNVTPDSFSDGGRFAGADDAIAAGRALHVAGAEIVDIGGESTRPGAAPISVEEELDRVVPVIEALAGEGIRTSIDTRHAAVMEAALAAGATLINDVTALTGDPASLGFVASCAAPVVLMHMQGEPRTMQADPHYADVTLDVFDELQAHLRGCETAGIAPERLVIDPGIGFGKTLAHNLTLLADLALLHGLGRPVLLGASRKSFIGRLDTGAPADGRLAGSLAVAQAAADHGVAILRVHDVPETRQMLRLRAAMAALPN